MNDRRKQRGDIEIWLAVGILLAIPLGIVGVYFFAESQCASACAMNGDKHNYLVGQGCYCLDDRGAYNPNDERGPQ